MEAFFELGDPAGGRRRSKASPRRRSTARKMRWTFFISKVVAVAWDFDH
ncbi:MAG: hypothetical protein ACJAQT_000330 [Akkermansiaceae bacterium]